MIVAWLKELKERWQAQLSWRGRCPRCASRRVWHNGIRRRKVSLRQADRTLFIPDVPVRRLRCGDCVKRWSHEPERVLTKAHYQPCVVAAAVGAYGLDKGRSDTEIADSYGCHRRTLMRWVKRVAQVADPEQLARRLLLEADSVELPAPPAPVARRSAVMQALSQRAVLVLALLDALGSFLGLAPPGLGHAPRLVPAPVPPSGGAL